MIVSNSSRFPYTGILVFLWGQVSLVLAGWIDIETPLDKRTTSSLVDGTTYHLVMSDEFNVDNRTFKDGHDAMWTALDKSDEDASSSGGGSMQFYNSSAVTTQNGMLQISTYIEKTEWNHHSQLTGEWKRVQTNFTSGMVQTWNKFCFTGGIVEMDVIFPGDPRIGGLWPAIWMLGNLGRATYEASTNNIWPWSYNVCDRQMQESQAISACNVQNHFGMHPFQGRGATEIDIVEVMSGESRKPFKNTHPRISFPYGDMTLQSAPGVDTNRPQNGNMPNRQEVFTKSNFSQFAAQTWYDGLEMNGKTSLNSFFYGTYLAETKKNEPVSRNKKQAFQADAIGAVHQLTSSHFEKLHTFRIEWQPGKGGRLDWFVKSYNNTENSAEGDSADGDRDWVRAFTIHDKSLGELMGSEIPNEPSYLILNTAISSTWGFPFDVPEGCTKCYDCNDPKCACAFNPGFCAMLRSGVSMYIDSVRVYQSRDDAAHVGRPHTLGCDPLDYPTKEWIEGHMSRYMRNPPFSLSDRSPLRNIQRGGGKCQTHMDCGGGIETINLTRVAADAESGLGEGNLAAAKGRGECIEGRKNLKFLLLGGGKVCSCAEGFTGPHCLSLAHWDNFPSAHKIRTQTSPFLNISGVSPSLSLRTILAFLSVTFLAVLIYAVREERRFQQAHNHGNGVSTNGLV